MSNSERRPRSSRKRKIQRRIENASNRVGLSPSRIFFGILLAGGLAALLYWVVLQGRPKKERRLTANDKEMVAIKLDRKLDDLAEISKDQISSNETFLVIENMQSRLRELDEIEAESQLTEKQQIKVSKIRLKSEGVIVVESLENGFECGSTRESLNTRCRELAASENRELAELAGFTKVIVDFSAFGAMVNANSYEEFKLSLGENAGGIINNISHTNAIANLVSIFCKKRKGGEYNEKLCNMVSGVLTTSSIDEIRICLLYTSPSPRDLSTSRMPSSA